MVYESVLHESVDCIETKLFRSAVIETLEYYKHCDQLTIRYFAQDFKYAVFLSYFYSSQRGLEMDFDLCEPGNSS